MDLFTTNWRERASSDPVVNWMFRDYIYQQDKINTNTTSIKIQDGVPKSENTAKKGLKNAKISSSTSETPKKSSKKSGKSKKSAKKDNDTVTTSKKGVTKVPKHVATSSGGYPIVSKNDGTVEEVD